jgi:hypothetical protein
MAPSPRRSTPRGHGPSHVAIADLDRDGFADLAVTNRDAVPGSISILGGDGTGAFAPPQNVAVPLRPQCVVAGDFDEDGRLDLAVTGFDANLLAVLLNRTPGAGGDPCRQRRAGQVRPRPRSPHGLPQSGFGDDIDRSGPRRPADARLVVVSAAGPSCARSCRPLAARRSSFLDGRDQSGAR